MLRATRRRRRGIGMAGRNHLRCVPRIYRRRLKVLQRRSIQATCLQWLLQRLNIRVMCRQRAAGRSHRGTVMEGRKRLHRRHLLLLPNLNRNIRAMFLQWHQQRRFLRIRLRARWCSQLRLRLLPQLRRIRLRGRWCSPFRLRLLPRFLRIRLQVRWCNQLRLLLIRNRNTQVIYLQ